MKIETTTGHYGITVSGDIADAKLTELATLGLSQGVLYRGVFAKLRETTGAKRELDKSAAFDATVGEKVKAAIAEAVRAYGTFDVTVAEYIGGESTSDKPTKEATEMWTAVQAFPDKKFAAACVKLGIERDAEGDVVDEDQAILACKAHLRRTREAAKAAAMAELS